MGAADEHLRASGGISYLNDVDLDAVTLFELFGLDALICGKHGFRKFAVEAMRMETLPLRGSIWETTPVRISCSLGELLKDEAALGFAYALDDDLLCGLSRDAAELLVSTGTPTTSPIFARLLIFFAASRFISRLASSTSSTTVFFHDHVYALLVLVKNGFNIVRAVRIVTAEGREHCLINFVVHVASGNALFLLDIFYGFKNSAFISITPFISLRAVLPAPPVICQIQEFPCLM